MDGMAFRERRKECSEATEGLTEGRRRQRRHGSAEWRSEKIERPGLADEPGSLFLPGRPAGLPRRGRAL